VKAGIQVWQRGRLLDARLRGHDKTYVTSRGHFGGNSGNLRVMHLFGHLVGLLVLIAVFLGGFALFWIARQDDSRAGRLIGLIAMAASAFTIVWLSRRLF